jgi:hypothetical protein
LDQSNKTSNPSKGNCIMGKLDDMDDIIIDELSGIDENIN